MPALLDYLAKVGGPKIVDVYNNAFENTMGNEWYRLTWEDRRDRRVMRPIWWGIPTKNTRDRATATLPRLLNERMDELGMDFSVIYPSMALFFPLWNNDELRRAACRAVNMYHADVFRPFSSRMTPAAVIPMHTPDEAVEELEFAVKTLGLKTVMLGNYVTRPVPASAKTDSASNPHSRWIDNFCVDSAYNYDPVWAKCIELGVVPTFHGQGMGWGSRTSISNFTYNHVGHAAASQEMLAKALIMGGVMRRFPTLNVAFLECGVGWACNLLSELLVHWQSRNVDGLERVSPDNYDREGYLKYLRDYGSEQVLKGLGQAFDHPTFVNREDPAKIDEWKAAGIGKPEDIRDLFVPNFHFGCAGSDPMNAWAFNTKVNPFGARLKAVFGSGIGHFRVGDMRDCVANAHQLVKNEIITEDDFRDLTFTNMALMHVGVNPGFFKGTIVEGDVAKLVASKRKAA